MQIAGLGVGSLPRVLAEQLQAQRAAENLATGNTAFTDRDEHCLARRQQGPRTELVCEKPGCEWFTAGRGGLCLDADAAVEQ